MNRLIVRKINFISRSFNYLKNEGLISRSFCNFNGSFGEPLSEPLKEPLKEPSTTSPKLSESRKYLYSNTDNSINNMTKLNLYTICLGD